MKYEPEIIKRFNQEVSDLQSREQLKDWLPLNVIEAMERVQDLIVRSQPRPKE